MKRLARWAGAALLLSALAATPAFAATAAAPDWLDAVSALYGPACGVLVALVVLCERVARIIPNSTESRVLKMLLVVTTILGVKVPDNQ